MPWGHERVAMNRGGDDSTLLAAAAAAGLELRALHGLRCGWAFTHDDLLGCEAFAVRRSPSHGGLGGFATRSFVRGECVLTEAPLVLWKVAKGATITHEDAEARIKESDEAVQRLFWSLCQNERHGTIKHPFGIWLSNAYPTADASTEAANHSDAEQSSAVFTHICRLNHSCSPNLHCCWNEVRGAQTIHALCDIASGDELTVSYLPLLERPRSARRAALRDGFGFECMCAACCLDGDALVASERRRTRLEALDEEMRAAADPSRAADAMRKALESGADVRTAKGQQKLRALQAELRRKGIALVEERLALLEQEGAMHASRAWRTYEAAAKLCTMLGDGAESGKWNAKAAKCALLALGRQSAEFMRYAALLKGGGGAGKNG